MIIKIIVGVVAGFLGALGIGGGSVLIIYLTLFENIPQIKAQGINLIFFIPCACVAIIFHIKNKLIEYKMIIPLIVTGLFGVVAGIFVNSFINDIILRKIFGIFLIVLAVFQLKSNRQQALAVKKG